MANKANKDALESVGGGDVFAPPEWKLTIAEEDPDHPKHDEHMARVRRDKPEMQALLASMRLHGWRKSVTIAVFKDGDRWIVSEGRRRLTCLRIENKRRLDENDERGPLRPRIVLDDDPVLTTALANEMREPDPPMVRARRFVELREVMGAEKAAAAIGETLAFANSLAKCLSLPADIQAKVNSKELPPDVAARVAKKEGAPGVAKVVEAAKGEDGKVDPAKARAAANEMPKRQKAVARPIGLAMATRCQAMQALSGNEVASLLRYILGDREQVNGRAWLLSLVKDAETAAKEGGKGSDAREAAE